MSDLVATLDDITSGQELLTLFKTVYTSISNNPRVLFELAKKCQSFSLTQHAQLLCSRALDQLQDLSDGPPQWQAVLKEFNRSLIDQLIDRWHFLMLNDIQRNSCYFKAIVKAVRRIEEEERGEELTGAILDIGSGTGILSMMAVRAGASRVYACELSEVMIELSKTIFDANQVSDYIHVIHAVSTDLNTLPHSLSLIISETVDAGLLGEMIIPSLRHAWNTLVWPLPSNGHVTRCHVIPCGATVYVCAVECIEIRRKTKLLNPLILSFIKDLTIRGSCHFNEDRYSTLQEEPYTCERLSRLKGGFKYLTSPQIALQFDFTIPEVPLPSSRNIELPVTSPGRYDALVSWFTLHLDDQVSFSTSPSCDSSPSWEQAVYPVHDGGQIFENQSLIINASCTDVLISLTTVDIIDHEATGDHHSNTSGNTNEYCNNGQLIEDSLTPNGVDDQTIFNHLTKTSEVAPTTRTSEELLEREQGVAKLTNKSSMMEERGGQLVIDYTETKRHFVKDIVNEQTMEIEQVEGSGTQDQSTTNGANNSDTIKESSSNSATMEECPIYTNDTSSIHYIERSELARLNDENYINTLMEAILSKVPSTKSTLAATNKLLILDLSSLPITSLIHASQSVIDYLLLGNVHLYYYQFVQELIKANNLEDIVSLIPVTSALIASHVTWDFIICDLVTPQGVLDATSLELLKLLNPESCQLLCHTVELHIVGVASPTLRAHSSVLGTVPTLGFDIARFINKYQVTHYTELDMSTLPYTSVTSLTTVTLSVTDYCNVNTVLPMEVITDESLTGFSYWFTLHYHGNQTISTGPNGYPGSHFSQAVFLLQEDIPVNKGQTMNVQVMVEEGVLDISSDSLSKLTLPPHNTIPTYYNEVIH